MTGIPFNPLAIGCSLQDVSGAGNDLFIVEDGWIFAGAESLDTLVTGDGLHSGIARCGTNTTSADGVFGYESTKDWNLRLDGVTPSSANVSLNYDNTLATETFSGINILDVVVCAARNQGYVDGSRFISLPGTLQTWSNATVTIAGAYASAQLDGTMKAFALYTRQLTEDEVVDLTAQMAALTSSRPNPQRVNDIIQRPSTKRLNSTSHELLIATDAGIYHTISGGRSWTKITTLNEPSNAEFSDSPAATLEELEFHGIQYGNTSVYICNSAIKIPNSSRTIMIYFFDCCHYAVTIPLFVQVAIPSVDL